MATWNSRGLRGSFLEELINMTIEKYQSQGLALIQKIPTPITPVKMDKQTRQITLAYFEQRSTVDYIGVVQGIPVCFDAKECAAKRFPLANIHPHQMEFMKTFEEQKGISFFLIYFKQKECYMYVPYSAIEVFWSRMQEGGPKSFSYEELDPSYEISTYSGTFVHFLENLNKDLISRNEG